MDVSKLSTGDKVIGISAVLLLIFFFFPWYDFTVSIPGAGSATGGGRSGSSYFLFGWIPLLLAIAIVVCMYLQRFTDVKLPDLPVTWEQAYAIAAGVAALLIILRVLLADSRGSGFGVHVSANRKFGLFLAVLAVLGLLVGAIINMREAPAVAGGTDAGTPPPPPPPA